MKPYNMLLESPEYTVVSEYIPDKRTETHYQSEAELEKGFISLLCQQGYEYLDIHNEKGLLNNLRGQLQLLNNIEFSDTEWKKFFSECISGPNEGIVQKTRRIQKDHIQVLERDNGTKKNICLIDKENIHNNRLQVINQFTEHNGSRHARYDVTVLVNGLPLVHIELKRRGVDLKEAFNQIKRYHRDGFLDSNGLYDYVQIFVISNGTFTRYYSNTTRENHIKESINIKRSNSAKTSNSYEFTCCWAAGNNKHISDLVDFTKTFMARHTVLNILTRYCVWTSNDMLLAMRPYQIFATERILERIKIAYNNGFGGTIKAGGYIWHTTGSGKTLTSFKTAQLASQTDYVDKVLFVVDRKDLDYQTICEYEKFQKGAANSNTSTKILQGQLEDPEVRIIVTTIQKLDRFISQNRTHNIYGKNVVIIFDECHRSQFGDMHKRITDKFKKYCLFGFTGTPIFEDNAENIAMTTERIFGAQLHCYTIIDAIRDKNVLPFRIDYMDALMVTKTDGRPVDKSGRQYLSDPRRISAVVSYILKHFDQKTKRNAVYSLQGKRLSGFNSILATGSIEDAKKYYTEIKRQIAESGTELTVATIFSYNANEKDPGDLCTEEVLDTSGLDVSSREFLESAVADYNNIFKTNFSIDGQGFENYYKDISMRVKEREVDILVVVNMFLTGFDATTLNTLWVDKNLRQHGLIQAFSRTNRILNSVKAFGNIICFRNLRDETDKAIALFGNKDETSVILLKTFEEYFSGYEENGEFYPGYKTIATEFKKKYPPGKSIVGEANKKNFVNEFGRILKLVNILKSFDQFQENGISNILSERDIQDYNSTYIDIYQDDRAKAMADEAGNGFWDSDVVYEIDLLSQIEVNVDYILNCIRQNNSINDLSQALDLSWARRAINSSIDMRKKRGLFESFFVYIEQKCVRDNKGIKDLDLRKLWDIYERENKDSDLVLLIEGEKLKKEETKRFMSRAFRDGVINTAGTVIDELMPPMSRFGNGERAEKKRIVIEKLTALFEKYYSPL